MPKFSAILSHRYTRIFLSSLVIIAVISVPPISNYLFGQVSSAGLSPAKLLLGNSQSAATSVTYSFRFTGSASTAIKQLKILFCTTASGTCTVPTGMTTTGAAFSGSNISNTGRSGTYTANGTLQEDWSGTTAQSPLAMTYDVTGITNSSSANTTFFARITTYSDAGTTAIDSMTIAAATLSSTSIALSATVDPNFTFTVAPVIAGNVNSAVVNVTTGTAASVPFGVLNTTNASVSATDVTVTTNAGSGYQITASQSATSTGGTLLSGTNDIDAFTGTNTSPTAWSAPAGSANANSGFFGYTTEDATLCSGTAARFTSSGGNKWAGLTTTGTEVVCSASPVTSEITRLGWQIGINTSQPSGNYTGTVILIATPTY